MITRAKAEEAWLLLRTYARMSDELWDSDEMVSFEGRTASEVNSAYRAASKYTHPDMGGKAEDFARVDHAKHVMLRWLVKPATAPAPAHKARKCENCQGHGYVHRMIGFKLGPRVQCHPCRGTGDADYEPDEGSAQ
jgi:hypothetical protein